MINRFFWTISVLCLVALASAIITENTVPDDIKGTYWNAEKTGKIRMYKATNGKYYGKLVYMDEPNDVNGNPKKDPNNPNASLRDRPLLDMVIVRAFSWDEEESEWSNGTIYNPEDGKVYSAYFYFQNGDKNKLYLRGYVMGMPFLGKTTEWSRIK